MEFTSNPFNITFGEEPSSFIPRISEAEQIEDTFLSPSPESKIFVITGPRGTGKTVLLGRIKRSFEANDDWISIDLNPYGDMLEQLAAKLYDAGRLRHLFLKAEFSFSFKGFGFTLRGENPISNIESLLGRMFVYLKGKGKRVLITVDDVSNNENVRYFAHSFQSFLREGYDVYLLMTGLYENVENLENDKSLTFLVRAPKIYLEQLNMSSIARAYQKYLDVDEKTAVFLAKLSKGYAYGFQLLGNLLYKSDGRYGKDVLMQYDEALDNNVYSLIWKTLSAKDKEVLTVIAEGNENVSEILKATKMKNATLQVYKGRLRKAGLINASSRGKITLSLPRFKEFVLWQKAFEG